MYSHVIAKLRRLIMVQAYMYTANCDVFIASSSVCTA